MTAILEPIASSTDLGGRTWVVIPAFNEGQRLADALSELRVGGVANIVVVDDGSHDGTARSAQSNDVWVLRHIVICGVGAR